MICRQQSAEAEQQRAAGKLPQCRLYTKARDIADSYLAVQKGVRGTAGQAAKAQTAADAAAHINSMPPCKTCEACINNMTTSTRRRCLRVRAFAAAAGGHTGAQVATLEGAALGARLQVSLPCSHCTLVAVERDFSHPFSSSQWCSVCGTLLLRCAVAMHTTNNALVTMNIRFVVFLSHCSTHFVLSLAQGIRPPCNGHCAMFGHHVLKCCARDSAMPLA
jgi:hypothetical protein